tara:strand:+ start:1439 stop:3880 length:2442 start_codon:yes stop_codon:yes gene_type:complete
MERYSNADGSAKVRKKHEKEYLGNYIGIVVQNNDPDKRGRVKVFVPDISATVYENWNKKIEDKYFKFIGTNVESPLTDIIDDLQKILPWAECAAPLAGASSSGRYHAHSKIATTSDSSKLETAKPDEDDNIAHAPSRLYESDPVNDAYNDNTDDDEPRLGAPNKVNKHTHNYLPSSYNNRAKGVFGVPNVGSHVWVFFEGGNLMSPVYFAAAFGDEDWKGIYDQNDFEHGLDYPGTYENKSDKVDASYNHNTETYRNKFVINQKGGSLEFINTDNREAVKLSHHSGSFKELNGSTSIELATGNDQKLVMADQFLTVRGHRNEYTDYDYEMIVRGDHYKKIGSFNKKKFSEWHDAVEEIANIKQRFEIKRVQDGDWGLDQIYIATGSTLVGHPDAKSKGHSDGGYEPCPLCSHNKRPKVWTERHTDLRTLTMPVINSSNNGYTATDNTVYTSNVYPYGEITQSTQSREFVRPVDRVDNINPSNFLEGGVCPLCYGSGFSPSTQGGLFETEGKDKNLIQALKDELPKLTRLEKEMGLGGSEITHITKHKMETIGLLMNDFPSIRMDHFGKLNNNEMRIRPDGVFTMKKVSPLIERVHVDDMPGGTYNINASNRFNVLAGAGGIVFKTYGCVDVGGTVVTMAGEQVNIASENEINITSGKRLNIVSDILTLRQKEYGQVLVDSNLGVSQNVIIGGSTHIDGELFVNHVTAPIEIQETEQIDLYGKLLSGLSFNCNFSYTNDAHTVGSVTLTSDSNDDKVRNYHHSHQFKNLPLHLVNSSQDVRKLSQRIENPERDGAAAPENINKGIGLTNTGEEI